MTGLGDGLDELMAGPCGKLSDLLAREGQTSSIVTRPEPGILFGSGAATKLLELLAKGAA